MPKRIATLLLCLLPVFAWADDRFELGKKKAAVCMACHGETGVSSIGIYPNLQGQKVDYMVATLKAYKRRQRQGGLALVMYEQADKLTEQDMQDVSYFFSKVSDRAASSVSE